MTNFDPVIVDKEIVIKSFNAVDYYGINKDFHQINNCKPYWEMVYVDRGDVTSVYDGREHVISEEHAVFHPPYSSHSYISNKHMHGSIIVISFVSDSIALNDLQGKIFQVTNTAKRFLSLFMEEYQNYQNGRLNFSDRNQSRFFVSSGKVGLSQLMECHFLTFLYSIIRTDSYENIADSKSRTSVASKAFAEILKAYLKDNISRKLTIDDLCKKFNLSQTNLCKKWKENYNIGIIKYFSSLKMEEAKSLIKGNEYSITQIAEILGYSTVHHFSYAFKKFVGMSPSEYKKIFVLERKTENYEKDSK